DPQLWGSGINWTAAQESALEGGDVPSSCAVWGAFQSLFTPTTSYTGVPSAHQYDAQTNPCGIRADLWGYSINELGHRPPAAWTAAEKACGRGFANRPFDNVGVQYGLTAFESGAISPAQ